MLRKELLLTTNKAQGLFRSHLSYTTRAGEDDNHSKTSTRAGQSLSEQFRFHITCADAPLITDVPSTLESNTRRIAAAIYSQITSTRRGQMYRSWEPFCR